MLGPAGEGRYDAKNPLEASKSLWKGGVVPKAHPPCIVNTGQKAISFLARPDSHAVCVHSWQSDPRHTLVPRDAVRKLSRRR